MELNRQNLLFFPSEDYNPFTTIATDRFPIEFCNTQVLGLIWRRSSPDWSSCVLCAEVTNLKVNTVQGVLLDSRPGKVMCRFSSEDVLIILGRSL